MVSSVKSEGEVCASRTTRWPDVRFCTSYDSHFFGVVDMKSTIEHGFPTLYQTIALNFTMSYKALKPIAHFSCHTCIYPLTMNPTTWEHKRHQKWQISPRKSILFGKKFPRLGICPGKMFRNDLFAPTDPSPIPF